MKKFTVSVSVLAVAAVVGWKVTSHRETSTGLQDIKLIEHSEHSHPGPSNALAGIRIRLSPSDFDDAIKATPGEVPQIALAAE
jgi:hypothetical protein